MKLLMPAVLLLAGWSWLRLLVVLIAVRLLAGLVLIVQVTVAPFQFPRSTCDKERTQMLSIRRCV